MANEIRVPIEVTKEREAERKLKQVGDAAERAGDSLEQMGDQAEAAGKSSEKAGDDFRGAGEDAGFLNRQVVETSENLKKLVHQLNATGDTSLLKDIRKERRSLRQFENLAKEIAPKPTEIADAGKTTGTQFIQSISASVSAGGPFLAAALGVVAVAAAPGLAATVGAAVVGGVGAGGIIGGIALAGRDPRVQAVAKDVGGSLLQELQNETRGFIDPVIRSLEKIGNAGWAEKLGPSFDKLAAKVDPLADGLIGLVDGALPGLQSALDAAGPILDVLSNALPEIGDAIGDFFESVSDNPEALANALELFIDEVTAAIRFGGDLIETLIGIYDVAYKAADALGLISEDEILLQKSTKDTSEKIEELAGSTEDAEQAMRDFDDAISDVFGRTLSVREATLRYEQAIDDLTEGIKGGSRSLREDTEAGRENWQMILDASRAIEGQREARVRQGMSIEESNAKYEQELEALRKQLISLGYNKEAVNKYIAELKKVPTEAITEVHIRGIKAAIGDVRTLAGLLGGIAGYGIVQGAIASSSAGRRASGGPVAGGKTYWVGEQGPELVTFGQDGYVHNAAASRAMTSGASGGMSMVSAGGAAPQIVVSVVGTGALAQALAESLRFEVRTTANGNAQEFWGTANGG